MKKFWRKKMFSLKSMTKLEDLTVLLSGWHAALNTHISTKRANKDCSFQHGRDIEFCIVNNKIYIFSKGSAMSEKNF